jgi:fumarate reductase subunit D
MSENPRRGSSRTWLARISGGMLLVLVAPALAVLLAIFLVLVPPLAALDYVRRKRLRRTFAQKYGQIGKDLVLVYSDSPHWKEYVESRWLPKYGNRAVVLNWSERRLWATNQRLEAGIFKQWAGTTEFNPIAIVFPRRGPVRVIRFWQAFKDFKHGKEVALRQAENELDAALQASRLPGA